MFCLYLYPESKYILRIIFIIASISEAEILNWLLFLFTITQKYEH